MSNNDIIQLCLSNLLNKDDIIQKYDIFFNGTYIIASYKDGTRLYKENVDQVLKIKVILPKNNDYNIISKSEIYNSELYNFYIIFDNYKAKNISDLHNTKFYMLSRDILIDDIKDNKLILNNKGYILTNEYMNYSSTRTITITIK